MKIKILSAIAALAMIQPPAGAETNIQIPPATKGKETSLSEILGAVLANNPTLMAAHARWQAARERIPQAAAWEDPRLDYSQTLKRLPTIPKEAMVDSTVMIEQSIPLSGKNLSRARAARAEAISAYEEFRRTQLDVLLRARKAFYRYEAASAEIDINRRTEQVLRQFSEISRAKYEVGGRAQSDVLMAETELTKNSEACEALRQELSEAQSELNLMMNRMPQEPIGNPVANVPVMQSWSLDALRPVVLAHRPELQMARARIDAEKARVQMAKREMIPDPALRVGLSRYNEASNAVSEISAGVSIPLPWVNAKKYSAEVREAQANLEEAQRLLDAQSTEALAAVRDQIKRIETFHHHYMLYHDKILPLARQIVKSEQAAYESDKTTFLELMNAQQSLNGFEHDEFGHLRDYKIAIAELEAIVGNSVPPATSIK